jgi:hypothetical protein
MNPERVVTAFYECKTMPLKWYVGCYPVRNHGPREIFQYDHDPTDDEGFPYGYIIGPCRDEQEAIDIASYRRSYATGDN